MTEHYFAQEPSATHDEREVIFEVLGKEIHCITDAGTFSRSGLDMGTRILLNALPELSGRVLDLGCGWGAVAVTLGMTNPTLEIMLTDVNSRAVALAERNLTKNNVLNARCVQGDGFEKVEGKFDAILLNPPIRSGKESIYKLFDTAREYLFENGALYIVIRKQQGAESAQKHLEKIYSSVTRIAREKGYWVFMCDL